MARINDFDEARFLQSVTANAPTTAVRNAIIELLKFAKDSSDVVNYPPASWGASVARILTSSSLKFALQRLKTLLATPPCDSSPQQAAGYSR